MKRLQLIPMLLIIALMGAASSNKSNTYNAVYNNGYLVYSAFEVLLTDKQFECHKYKAVSEFKKHECGFCNQIYYSQVFEDVNGERGTWYSNASCSDRRSKTKFHDNLNLSSPYACTCISIGFK